MSGQQRNDLVEYGEQGLRSKSDVVGNRVAGRKEQRLHGAWQGGWSAGHYNTVGSREGWEPAKYDRGTKQSVEDFMDEEDLRDMMKSTMRVKRTFAPTTPGAAAAAPSAASPDTFLDTLIRPSSDYIGELLLRRLGWVEVIPAAMPRRRNAKRPRATRHTDAYGSSGGEESDEPCHDTLAVSRHPQEPGSGVVEHQGTQGLGYTPGAPPGTLRGRGVEDDQRQLTRSYKKRRLFGGGGYGDDDDDDDGLGGGMDMDEYDDAINLGADDRQPAPRAAKHTAKDDAKLLLEKGYDPLQVAETTKLFAGWAHLFVASSPGAEAAHPAPCVRVPAGWRARRPIDLLFARQDIAVDLCADVAALLPRRQRAALEAQGQAIVQEQERRRRKNRFDEAPEQGARSAPDPVPPLVEAGPPKPAPGAAVFRPLKGSLGLRFTSGKRQELARPPAEVGVEGGGVAEPAQAGGLVAAAEIDTSEVLGRSGGGEAGVAGGHRHADEARKSAASAGEYGPQTREVRQWYPDGLICKRLGVPDPFPHTREKGDMVKSKTREADAATRLLLGGGGSGVPQQQQQPLPTPAAVPDAKAERLKRKKARREERRLEEEQQQQQQDEPGSPEAEAPPLPATPAPSLPPLPPPAPPAAAASLGLPDDLLADLDEIMGFAAGTEGAEGGGAPDASAASAAPVEGSASAAGGGPEGVAEAEVAAEGADDDDGDNADLFESIFGGGAEDEAEDVPQKDAVSDEGAKPGDVPAEDAVSALREAAASEVRRGNDMLRARLEGLRREDEHRVDDVDSGSDSPPELSKKEKRKLKKSERKERKKEKKRKKKRDKKERKRQKRRKQREESSSDSDSDSGSLSA